MKITQFITLFLLSSFLGLNTLSAQSQLIEKVEGNPEKLILNYEKWKLPNGLTLIIHEDHSDPIVSVVVTYHVGSAREEIGKSGFAHFFEHMMFEGSTNVGDKEHFRIVNEAGGDMNGNTERDRTNYYENVPSNYLETALWLEADRMGFLLDSVTKAKFEIQRATVKNEKAQNVENQPYAMAFVEVLNQILYPSGHPYSWPVIGYVDDLNRVTVDDLKSFFLRWYGPNNAVLSIAGDVNSKEVVALVEKYFGSIKPCPDVPRMKVSVPILATNQYANYVDNVYFPMTIMTYPTVPQYHRDEPAIDLLGDMIGSGNNSLIYKNFIKSEKAIQASAYHESSELAGELQVIVATYPEFEYSEISKGFNETEKQILATFDEFEKAGITDEALQRAKTARETQTIDMITSVDGKAYMFATWQTFLNKPYNFSDEMDRYNKVTKEDIIRVFNKYIKGKSAAIVNVYPKDPMSNSKDSVKSVNPYANVKIAANPEMTNLKYDRPVDNFDRSKQPAPASPKTPVVPNYYSKTFDNGLKIIGTQATEAPKVVMIFSLRGGKYVFNFEDKKTGLAELTSAMMNEGTEKSTTEEISAKLEKLGSEIYFYTEGDKTNIRLTSLSKNIDATLAILEEKLLHPGFIEADFKRTKKAALEGLMHEKKVAEAIADKLFDNILYGNTVHGSYASEKTMKKLSLDDVKNYYKEYYSPKVCNLVVVSDIPENELVPKLDFLKKWSGKDVSLQPFTAFVDIPKTQIYLAHKDDAAQSVISIGHGGLPYDATGEYFKSKVANFPLGGAFNSRLNLNLREAKGYTYGIRSAFQGTEYPGPFFVYASVKLSATDSSITEIMKELNNYTSSGISTEELAFTKNSILNNEALKYETPEQKASFLSQILRYNLSKDFTQTQSSILKEMSKSDADAIIKKNIHPDKMIILVVGNRYMLKDKLEKLGYGKVKEVDLD
ncbi:MAG: insulinase family protein [Bacteroidetes bacterium]|nr:MAG: insulinase family protein [Bacteroidota bacterium]